jgi:ABC-type lipoprotein export system ATPase subunit
MVTHAPDIAERAGRRIVIHDGQILQDDARAGRGSRENIES